MSAPELTASSRSFGGWQNRYQHQSETLNCKMTFSVYLPPHASESATLPALFWLSGLTCNDENFVQKAGAQRVAARLGMILICPDTSPRGDDVADAEDGAYDLGLGAGFYVNATQEPWKRHYHMYDYIVDELPKLVRDHFNVQNKFALAGHSMGGHGALVIGLSNMRQYTSVSAFAPIVCPSRCEWGKKAFSHYLGDNKATWKDYDACHLLAEQGQFMQLPIRIDQGLADDFFKPQRLTLPFEDEAKKLGYPAEIFYHQGYDHSYFFIASFIEQHLEFHMQHLKAG